MSLGPYEILIARGAGYELPVKVSPEDIEWALAQGNWFVTHATGNTARGDKPGYPCRSSWRRDGKKGLIWLHKEVLWRSVGEPPTEAHIIGNHRNGDKLDARRLNLRWATHSMNARNLHGQHYRQFDLFERQPEAL